MSHDVFLQFTMRSLAANRVRTAVTVVGIALATGLLMAVLSSVTSLRQAMLDQVRASSGVWQIGLYDADDATLDRLRDAAGEHLDRLALLSDYGAAALSSADAESYGAYLGVLSLPAEQDGCPHAAGDDAFNLYPTPTLTEGRLPERPGEIALPDYLRGAELSASEKDAEGAGATQVPGADAGASSDGALELGGEVTLSLGRRVLAEEPAAALDSGLSLQIEYVSDQDPADPDGEVMETLADVGAARPFTVVGFVETDYDLGNVAFVCADEPAATASGTVRTTAYFSTTGYASSSELDALAHEALGEKGGGWVTNSFLLTYQGLEERAVFDALSQMAAVLAAVIVLAAVSLIAGAFIISVSERTRQFGLLSSLGASARQLRRTVLLEAAALGVVGIPLGLVLGIAATAVVFSITGEGWQAIVGSGATVSLVARPEDVALSAGLSVVTLLLSACVPALRASRVSAVDAIRQARDVRASRRLRRVFSRRRGARDSFSADCRRPRGLAARLGGMPAFLARRTLAVSASKNRAAAASLAVSVALLVTAGLVSTYLTGATSYVSHSGAADVRVYVIGGASARSAEEAAADTDAADASADDAGAPLDVNKLAEAARSVSGIGSASCITTVTGVAHVDPSGIDRDDLARFAELSDNVEYQLDASGYGPVRIGLVDDETWRTLADEVGLDHPYHDPARLSCVVLNVADVTTTEAYGHVTPFTGAAGEVRVALEPELGDYQYLTFYEGTYCLVAYDPDTYEQTSDTPASELGLSEVSVPVAFFAEDLGDSFPMSAREYASDNNVTLLMPASSLAGSGLEELTSSRGFPSTDVCATFSGTGASESEVVDALGEAIEGTADTEAVIVYNIAEETRRGRATVFTVNVFLYCFTAITVAIAVASVFNSTASGMMLRAREFAALRSAGMGQRAFRKMIVLECADVAIKGLVGGAALAAIVNAALFRAMSLAFSTLALGMPWGHVALAFAVVVGVLAVSAAYALRRTRAMNLVEALRVDAL